MLEIPETRTIAHQAESMLTGKTISKVIEATSPHRFTWYNGDPKEYTGMLVGRRIESVRGHGAFVTLYCNDDIRLSISDGVNMKYYPAFEAHPQKHQLLIEFTDGSFLAFTVSMYGSIYAFRGKFDNPYYKGSLEKLSPLEDDFDEQAFNELFRSVNKDISIKALLATEQRIPGLGNGVLQDILFKAGLNPRRKISTITELQRSDLFHCLKFTLQSMTNKGGRDTEKDFYGNKGGYKCLLSKNTYKNPCPNCGDAIVKEAYLGGTVYYCASCQKL
ncbi:formamidopyrimidine-DNA glycosylase [Dysgonomonas sp. PH5-45]|uniref:DNA-formamidopyrimidine glycosylase family protein n=1 Tax=unclassified Dysgonomonas TaxID=2630389 RepID=UPI002474D64E|nr:MULTISPECIES: DNA-formamidopyrimidine glycosylase family protein [unclassified Dysgonomonas]MDH6353839.1 formamidopyrimidine-DNA glycosylase [Dysgonomonas sp. PH5-45]MDH6386741.1 formamidopyrimidine-DNA glycosylase [Dysgonomonas sp. PH5-37]